MKNTKTKTNLIWHWKPSSFVRSTINNSYKAIWSDSRKRTQGLWQKGCWTLVQLTWWLSFSLGWCLLAFGDLLCLLSRWLWRVFKFWGSRLVRPLSSHKVMLGWRPTSEATSGPSTTSARTLLKPLTRATAVYIMKEVKILAKMDSCSKIVYQTQLNEFS